VGETSSTGPILLGLVDYFQRSGLPRVGFFNPVSSAPFVDGVQRHVHLLKHACKLPDDTADT